MTAARGMLTQLGIDSASPVTKRFDFVSEDIIADEVFIDGNGLRGTLEHNSDRVRQGPRRIHGPLRLQPNAVEWALLLPWILGTAGSGSPTVTFALNDSLLTRFVAIDRNDGAGLFTYDTVAVNRAIIRGAEGGILSLDLDLVGKDETKTGSFPALSIDTANGPYVFTDLALQLGATSAITAKSFELTIDNHIDTERFFNSLTLSVPVKHDRTTTFSTSLPYGDYNTLYNTGVAGVAATAVFTYAGATLTFTIGNVKLPRRSPSTPGRAEIMLPLSGLCYKIGATPSLSVSQNPGP